MSQTEGSSQPSKKQKGRKAAMKRDLISIKDFVYSINEKKIEFDQLKSDNAVLSVQSSTLSEIKLYLEEFKNLIDSFVAAYPSADEEIIADLFHTKLSLQSWIQVQEAELFKESSAQEMDSVQSGSKARSQVSEVSKRYSLKSVLSKVSGRSSSDSVARKFIARYESLEQEKELQNKRKELEQMERELKLKQGVLISRNTQYSLRSVQQQRQTL